jgi:hypothetical protein
MGSSNASSRDEHFQENEDEEFLDIMTANETQGHHYEPKTKHQSMEYHHKVSPAKKKFKAQAGRKADGYNFLWMQMVLFTLISLNLGPLPIQSATLQHLNFEAMIKNKCQEVQEEHFAAT